MGSTGGGTQTRLPSLIFETTFILISPFSLYSWTGCKIGLNPSVPFSQIWGVDNRSCFSSRFRMRRIAVPAGSGLEGPASEVRKRLNANIIRGGWWWALHEIWLLVNRAWPLCWCYLCWSLDVIPTLYTAHSLFLSCLGPTLAAQIAKDNIHYGKKEWEEYHQSLIQVNRSVSYPSCLSLGLWQR